MKDIAKSISGPVTIQICEPDNALSLIQSQAINLSINSEIPNPTIYIFKYRPFYESVSLMIIMSSLEKIFIFEYEQSSILCGLEYMFMQLLFV